MVDGMVSPSEPAHFLFNTLDEYRQAPPFSLNIKMLTPEPHFSQLCLFTQKHANTQVLTHKIHNIKCKCNPSLSQQSKGGPHGTRKQQIVYWCSSLFELLQREKTRRGIMTAKWLTFSDAKRSCWGVWKAEERSFSPSYTVLKLDTCTRLHSWNLFPICSQWDALKEVTHLWSESVYCSTWSNLFGRAAVSSRQQLPGLQSDLVLCVWNLDDHNYDL